MEVVFSPLCLCNDPLVLGYKCVCHILHLQLYIISQRVFQNMHELVDINGKRCSETL